METFLKVIGAPETTAAVGSVTTPAMSPVVEVCAPTLTAAINTTNSKIECVCAKVSTVAANHSLHLFAPLLLPFDFAPNYMRTSHFKPFLA